MAKASATPEIFPRVMLLQGTVFLNTTSILMQLDASAEQKTVGLPAVLRFVPKTGITNAGLILEISTTFLAKQLQRLTTFIGKIFVSLCTTGIFLAAASDHVIPCPLLGTWKKAWVSPLSCQPKFASPPRSHPSNHPSCGAWMIFSVGKPYSRTPRPAGRR